MTLKTLPLAATVLAALLTTGCGGGGDPAAPAVTNMGATSVGYGKTTTVTVLGTGLNANLSATIEPGCPTMTRATSTDTQVTFTCKIAALGDLRARVRTEGGAELASLRLTVDTPQVSFSVTQGTNTGTFVVELDPTSAPITVNNFLNYVNSSSGCYYKATVFHRVVRDGFSIAQGGGYVVGQTGLIPATGKGPAIQLESNNGLKNLKYTIAMARTSDPNSATSEFYINGTDNPAFDYQSADNPGYAVFGKLVSGTDVYDVLQAVPTMTKKNDTTGQTFENAPIDNVLISACSQTR